MPQLQTTKETDYRIKLRGTDGAAVWFRQLDGEMVVSSQRMREGTVLSRLEAEAMVKALAALNRKCRPELVEDLSPDC